LIPYHVSRLIVILITAAAICGQEPHWIGANGSGALAKARSRLAPRLLREKANKIAKDEARIQPSGRIACKETKGTKETNDGFYEVNPSFLLIAAMRLSRGTRHGIALQKLACLTSRRVWD
jgi:hypothetical protein